MDCYNSIESLLLQLQDFLDRLQEYIRYRLDSGLRRRLIAILSTYVFDIATGEVQADLVTDCLKSWLGQT